MSQLVDFIKQQVAEVTSGNRSIPAHLKDKVMGGVSQSIVDSLKQTAGKKGGIEHITSLFTGKTPAASSPVTALAGRLFTSNVVPKLGLSPMVGSAVAALIPVILGTVISKVSSGKGFNLQGILSALGGASIGDKLKNVAGGLLGKLFK